MSILFLFDECNLHIVRYDSLNSLDISLIIFENRSRDSVWT